MIERNIALLTQIGSYYKDNSDLSLLTGKIQPMIRGKTFESIPHLGSGVIYSECNAAGWKMDILPLFKNHNWDDLSAKYQLIFVSALDMGVSRVKEILDEHPQLGKKMLIGGQGISPVAAELSVEYPDIAVFLGRADFQMQKILDTLLTKPNDFAGIHTGNKPDLNKYNEHPSLTKEYTFRNERHFSNSKLKPVEITTGCTQKCKFCTIAGDDISAKPLDTVIKEIETMKLGRLDLLLFVDHNLFNLNSDYLKELFTYINSKGILWSGEGTIYQQFRNGELMDVMAKDCFSFLSGLEDIHGDMEGSPVKINLVKDFDEVIGTLRKHKFPVSWSLVFGLDNHTPDTFIQTARFIDSNKLDVNCHLVQPRLGSDYQKKLTGQHRMTDEDSRNRNGIHLVYQPEKMSQEEALAGFTWLLGFVEKTAGDRFKYNFKIAGLRYATALASTEILADGLVGRRMKEMHPELKKIISDYDRKYKNFSD